MDKSFLKKIIDAISGRQEEESSIRDKSDMVLVRRYVENGDEGAFEEIINRHIEKVYGIALRILGDPNEAEEVLQEVFITLVEKIHTFRGDAKFSSWLYRVSVNACYMHIRAGKKDKNNISLEGYAPYDDEGTLRGKIKDKDWSARPDITKFSSEAMEIIERTIGELPEHYRIVFHLRDIEGLSSKETAEVLDLSVPAVKSRLHRARLFLRDKLSEYFHEWSK